MKFDPVIESLLDTDLYKFNMDQVIFHSHTNLSGRYYFKCRNKGVVFTPEMVEEINAQIDHLCTLTFKPEELDYLRSIRFIKNDYVEFLRLWRPLRDYVTTELSPTGKLNIVVEGPLFSAMQFEIYLLAIVNEVYFRMQYSEAEYGELEDAAVKKFFEKMNGFRDGRYNFKFAEFGTRRRFSRAWQDMLLGTIANTPDYKAHCVGTSNVYFAMKYNMTPIGTYAHEFVQMYQGIPEIPLAYTNKAAMQDWYNEYKGDNGTALTDTITTDIFLRDFTRDMANNYTGVRHDSGDPDVWAEKIIAHYESYGIDPKTKTLLFSDSLNFDSAEKLYQTYKDRVKVAFGIGTFVTNDTGAEPLNIVIKLQYVNGRPVAKLSDCDGKTMTQDEEYVEYLKKSVKFRLEEKE